jgi:hypothetical protein
MSSAAQTPPTPTPAPATTTQAPAGSGDAKDLIAQGLNALINKDNSGGSSSAGNLAQAPANGAAPEPPKAEGTTNNSNKETPPAPATPATTQAPAGAAPAANEAPPATTNTTPTTPTPPPPVAAQEPDYKALYLQQERDRQQQAARQLTQEQNTELAGRKNHIDGLETNIRSLEEDIAAAVEEYGHSSPQHVKLYNIQQSLRQSKQAAEYDYNQRLGHFNQSYNQLRFRAHAANLETSLKKDGLSLQDLIKLEPNLDITDNFAVGEVWSKAKSARLEEGHQAEIARWQAKVTEADQRAEEFRRKFDETAPGGQPDRGVLGGYAPASDPLTLIKSGRGALDLLDEGLKLKQKKG